MIKLSTKNIITPVYTVFNQKKKKLYRDLNHSAVLSIYKSKIVLLIGN